MDVAPSGVRGSYQGKYAFLTAWGSVAGSFAGLGLLQNFYSDAYIFWIIIGVLGLLAAWWIIFMVKPYIEEKNSLALEEMSYASSIGSPD